MNGGKSKAGSRNFESKLAVKKRKTKREKKAKDPNKPKRPPGPFFVFMEEFRKEYKKNNPENKSVAAVGKAGGNTWKNMSEEAKAPYIATSDKRKEEYEVKMRQYNKRMNGGDDEEGSDKSKSEVNDENEGNEEDFEGDD